MQLLALLEGGEFGFASFGGFLQRHRWRKGERGGEGGTGERLESVEGVAEVDKAVVWVSVDVSVVLEEEQRPTR